MLSFKHVEVFRAVMVAGSMSGACSIVHLTQSAISRIIANAESHLGYPLFNRTGVRLIPTQEGLLLFGESSELFAGLEKLRQFAENIRKDRPNRLRIAAHPAISHGFLSDVLVEYYRKAPSIVCEVRVLHNQQIRDALLTREVDLGLDFSNTQHPGLITEVLTQGPLRAIVPVGFAAGRHNPLVRLGELPLVSLVGEDPIAALQFAFCRRLGIELRLGLVVQTAELAQQAVARGLGWSVIDFLSADRLKPGSLEILHLPEDVQCEITAITVRNESTSIWMNSFLSLVRERARRDAVRAAAASQPAWSAASGAPLAARQAG